MVKHCDDFKCKKHHCYNQECLKHLPPDENFCDGDCRNAYWRDAELNKTGRRSIPQIQAYLTKKAAEYREKHGPGEQEIPETPTFVKPDQQTVFPYND